jgi:hypothetical protein
MTNEHDAIPPRPLRADFASTKEHNRAYCQWREKYDPARIAYKKEQQRKRTEAGLQKAYYDANRERLLADKQAYYQENRERLDELSRQYRKRRYAEDAEFRDKERERSKEQMRAYREANPGKIKESRIRYSENHKEEIAARNKEWRDRTGYETGPERLAYREANRQKIAERQRGYVERNKETVYAANKGWRQANPELNAEIQRKWHEAHPDYATEYRREYYASNKPRFLQQNRLREAGLKQARPKWLTKEQQEQIDSIYRIAEELTKATGIPHAVDHIWPLKGRKSCGLHVPWNLRVITKIENSKKKNREPAE